MPETKIELGFDPQEVDIERLARELDIPPARIKLALGLPFEAVCDATTVEEAQADYRAALEDSEAKWAAQAKWDELALAQVRAAATFEEALGAYQAAREGSEAERVALARWVELATTAEEAEAAYEATPSHSETKRVALVKLASFYRKTR